MRRGGIALLMAVILAGLLALGRAEVGGGREGRITFHEGGGARYRIAVVPAEEGAKRALTPDLSKDGNPSFSPQGDRIVFQRDGDIWVMNPDGSNTVNLTKTETYEGCPWFSGDGARIAFDGLREEKSDIFIINADGSNLRRLTRGPGNNACPAFGPDGRRIAFLSDRDGQMEIYLMDEEGRNQRRLTDHPATDMDPAISPDGRRIAFVSDRRGKFEVYLMDLDGTNLTRLTATDTFDIQPSFSPDGRWLAFERGGDIYAVNLKTKALVNLTGSPGYEGGPSWGP